MITYYLDKQPIWPGHKSPELGIVIKDEKGARSFPVLYLRKQKHISQEAFNKVCEHIKLELPTRLAEELFGTESTFWKTEEEQ